MKHLLLSTLASLALMACAAPSEEMEKDETAEVKQETVQKETMASGKVAPSLLISDGYVMAPAKGRDVAAAFFIVENEGSAVRLVSASSPIANSVEIHTHLMEDGVMKMREVDGVDVAENSGVVFEPGGFHLMLFGFDRAEGQMETTVTLGLDNSETMTVTLPIVEFGEQP